MSGDLSEKDGRYFIDGRTYNCPFCNRRNVVFTVSDHGSFQWDKKKTAYYYIIRCSEYECRKNSFHLSFKNLARSINDSFQYPPHEITYVKSSAPRRAGQSERVEKIIPIQRDEHPVQLDDVFFFHQPTSFFTVDERIVREIREPLSEAENCRKNNFLTGASACLRKAIYKLLKQQEIPEKNGDKFFSDEERIDLLKKKHSGIDPDYFSSLKVIQGISSQELHENDWEDLDGPTLSFLLETTHEILREIFVLPDQKNERRKRILALRQETRNG